HIAHDGVAEGNCMTFSIGFRAPTLASLARGVLDTAGDHIMARIGDFSGLYADQPLDGPVLDATYSEPFAQATNTPAAIPDELINAALNAAKTLELNKALAARFLGHWLSEPSASVYFEPCATQALDLSAQIPQTGYLELDRGTRMLYVGDELFINGELADIPASQQLRQLANQRYL